MSIIITINQKGARLDAIETLIENNVRSKYPEARISIERKEPAQSRNDRFDEAQSLVSDAKSCAEELRDELQDWLNNLPENLQQGSKADEIQQAIDELESFIDALDNAESASPEFPGMY